MSIPSHVLITTPLLTILFRRERDGRPATGGAELAKLVRSTKHECESTNDWRLFFPGLINGLTGAKYALAEDFTAGHSYQVDYRKGEVTLAHSFAAQGADLDKVPVTDIGNLKAFETWVAAHTPDSDGVVPIVVPALPAPSTVKPGKSEGKAALLAAAKAAVEAKQAKEAKPATTRRRKTDEDRLVGGVKHEVARLTKEKKAQAAKVDKAVEAAHAAAERAAITTRPPSEALAKAKALLRANLKPAVAAAS